MLIRDVPDFPKPGVVFKDITPVLAAPAAFRDVIELMAEPYLQSDVDAVLGIESRGFMFGAPLALQLGAAFVPVRKPGKLPRAANRVQYALEYGSDALEIHLDALERGARVLIVDDVIATGGTAAAAAQLATLAGAHVLGATFLMELAFLEGRARLGDVPMSALLRY
ncbi:MAG: adenine phosphoribosyltransferase [Myxococcales bacterium]